MAVPLKPNDRFAIVGKTGSGKTSFSTILAASLIPIDQGDYQAWWLDTKGDPDDIARLKRWGFLHVNSYKRDVPSKIKRHNRIYFPIREKPGGPSISAQSQEIIRQAMQRRKVLLIVDEYSHVVTNARNPGPHLGNAFRTGRGIKVGIIGCTQEPVFVPRQLLSQASHLFLFHIDYPDDVKKIKGIKEDYRSPATICPLCKCPNEPEAGKDCTDCGHQHQGYEHGFFTRYLDKANSPWKFYTDQVDWYNKTALPAIR